MTAAENAIDKAVADRRITQEHSDEIKIKLQERIKDLANGDFPEPSKRGRSSEPGPAAVSASLDRGMLPRSRGGNSFEGLHPPNASLQRDWGEGKGAARLSLGAGAR